MTDAWEVRQSEASGHWYVNTGREIWKCFDEDRARLIASARELYAEVERLKQQQRGDPLDTAQLRIAKLQAEGERLRAVINEITAEVRDGSLSAEQIVANLHWVLRRREVLE
jgi:hypothetical protein